MLYNPRTHESRLMIHEKPKANEGVWHTIYPRQSNVARGEDGNLYHSLDDPTTGKTTVTRLEGDYRNKPNS